MIGINIKLYSLKLLFFCNLILTELDRVPNLKIYYETQPYLIRFYTNFGLSKVCREFSEFSEKNVFNFSGRLFKKLFKINIKT